MLRVAALAGLASALLIGKASAAAEADKVDAIKRIMASKTFFLREPEKPFCREFLRDLKTFKDMRFAEPEVRASNYDDPLLEPYKAQCGGLPLNEEIEQEPRGALDREPGMSYREWRQRVLGSARAYYGTANFKVFRLDIDHNPRNGKELVFYHERAYGPLNQSGQERTYTDGGYNVFDGHDCDRIGGVPTHDPFDYFWRRSLDSHNAIISYRSLWYVVDLYEIAGRDADPSNPNYRLHVSTVGANRSHWCSYSTIPFTSRPRENSRNK